MSIKIFLFFCYFVCFNFLVKLPSGAENKKQPTEFFLMSIPSYWKLLGCSVCSYVCITHGQLTRVPHVLAWLEA